VLAGEHAPGAPEAGGHLVGDQQHVVAVAQLAHRAQVALGVHDHASRPLHERLHDHRGHLARVLGQHPLHVRGVAGLGVQRVEQQRAVERVEQVDPADRYGADRVAVVGHPQGDEPGAPLVAALAPVLEGHLERDLRGGRAGVGVEDAREAGWRELHQAPRQLDARAVAEAEHRRVGHAPELIAQRGVDARVAVAVDVAPERRHTVDVPSAVDVDQVGALGAVDDQRLLLDPALLLGERVPEVGAVGGCEVHTGNVASPPDVGSPPWGEDSRRLRCYSAH
jgi:hypothetical protein